ncbi:hypothetical protein OnM2_070063 [Erysiphe neolycopersici]|uniref:Uncharacterized protein n=1 Tax=Erysiphe neolycopersici TaxID=212602 RepID=A0A420HKU9_9PEZI|nr:hypothetical protein OnM2_070063 [Erysiphe neolycopersici]
MFGKSNLELESIVNKVLATQQEFELCIEEAEKKTNERFELIEKRLEATEKKNEQQFNDIMAAISTLKPKQETEKDKGKAKDEFTPPTIEFQPVEKKSPNLFIPRFTLRSKIEGSSEHLFASKTEMQIRTTVSAETDVLASIDSTDLQAFLDKQKEDNAKLVKRPEETATLAPAVKPSPEVKPAAVEKKTDKQNPTVPAKSKSEEGENIEPYSINTDISIYLSLLERDHKLVPALGYGFFVDATADEKAALVKSALKCIFSKPIGTGKNPVLRGLSNKPSNRVWANFCKSITEALRENKPQLYKTLENNSPLYLEYHSLWPDCSDAITASILNLKDAIKVQSEVRNILQGIATD